MNSYLAFRKKLTHLKDLSWSVRCRSVPIVLLLAAVQLTAQTSAPRTQSTPGASPAASQTGELPKLTTPEDEAVITIDVCDPPAAGTCQTRITRKQFEEKFRTVYAGQRPPNMRPPDAGALAHQYTQLLAFSYTARKEGLDKDPEFEQELQYVEMELLANALQKKLKEEFAHPSDQELQSYYNQIVRQFDEITVRCILIPRTPESEAAARREAGAAGGAPWPEQEDAEEQRIADNARAQLIEGEDPDEVEKVAYAAARSREQPPSTQPVKWQRNLNSPAPEQEMLFSLKPGDVTLPVANGHGLTIYELVSKRTIPLAEVRGQVKALYQMTQVQVKLNGYLESAHPNLNKEYFDTEKQAETKARELEEQQEEGMEDEGPRAAPQ